MARFPPGRGDSGENTVFSVTFLTQLPDYIVLHLQSAFYSGSNPNPLWKCPGKKYILCKNNQTAAIPKMVAVLSTLRFSHSADGSVFVPEIRFWYFKIHSLWMNNVSLLHQIVWVETQAASTHWKDSICCLILVKRFILGSRNIGPVCYNNTVCKSTNSVRYSVIIT